MVKATELIIGIILVGLVVGVFSIFMAGLNENYENNYNESSIEIYNQLSEVTNTTESIKNQVEDIREKSGILDIVGGFFGSAYNALKISAQSIDTVTTIIDQGAKDAQLGEATSLFKTAAISIIVVLIVIGVLIAAAVKRDL